MQQISPDKLQETRSKLIASTPSDQQLKKRGHFGSLFSANQYKWAYEQVARYGDPGEPVLDWGCGNGHFSLFLCDQGFARVDGFAFREPSLHGLLSAHEAFSFHRGDRHEPTRLPFADQAYQAVFSIGVLEHVREFGGDELASMREIGRVLREGGLFICAHLPNRSSMIEALARLGNRYHHKYTFSRKQIERLCRDSGFELIACNRYGLLPRNSFSGRLARLGNHPAFCSVLEGAESLLDPFCNGIAQNFGFVARKVAALAP